MMVGCMEVIAYWMMNFVALEAWIMFYFTKNMLPFEKYILYKSYNIFSSSTFNRMIHEVYFLEKTLFTFELWFDLFDKLHITVNPNKHHNIL